MNIQTRSCSLLLMCSFM